MICVDKGTLLQIITSWFFIMIVLLVGMFIGIITTITVYFLHKTNYTSGIIRSVDFAIFIIKNWLGIKPNIEYVRKEKRKK